MSTVLYNKIVRDKIPNIIIENGKKCTFEILKNNKYLRCIEEKMQEELDEYYKDKNIDELADLVEVIYAIAEAKGYTIEELERIRITKSEERGAFKKGVFLKEVYDDVGIKT